MIKVVIIDSNEERRMDFQRDLREHLPSLNKTLAFSEKMKGLQILESERIDVLFIYVEVGVNDSFEWIGHINRDVIEIVFLTDSQEVAIQALRLKITDIIYIPYTENELSACVINLEEKIRKKRELSVLLHSFNVNRLKQNESMFIKTTRSYIHIWMHTMTRLEADGNYTYIYLNDKKKILTSNHLKKYELLLERYDFYRVNKKFLINLHYVRFFHKGKNFEIEMEDGFKTEVSRNEKKGLKTRMENIASHTF